MASSSETHPATRNGVLRRHEVLLAGAACGLLGGLVMLLIVTIGAARAGLGPAAPLEAIGSTFVEAEALSSGARMAWGLAVLGSTAAGYGLLFAGIAPREMTTPCAAGLGLGYAILVVGIMTSFLVPWANPGFRDDMQAIGGTWIVAHALYGVTLGFVPAVRRALAGEAPRVPHAGAARKVPAAGER